MNTQKILTLLATLGLYALLISCSNSKASPVDATVKEDVEQPSIRQFNTLEVKPSNIIGSTNITGRVIPLQKVEVVAEVQGIARATSKSFKEGVAFKKGQTLVNIDRKEFQKSLAAEKSQFLSSLVRIMSDLKLDFSSEFDTWNQYLERIDIQNPLPSLPEITKPQLRYYLAANNILNLYYSIQSTEERLSKYSIVAPFDGTVTQSLVDVGALIKPNVKLGEFLRTDKYEISASVSISEISWVTEGQKVPFTSPDTGGEWVPTITRIGKRVDPSTQAVTVFLSVDGAGLKEGMYLEGKLDGHTYEDAFEIPKDLITRNNQVYIIEDSTVKLRDVELLNYVNGSVLVSGLSEGDLLVIDPVAAPIQGIRAVSK